MSHPPHPPPPTFTLLLSPSPPQSDPQQLLFTPLSAKLGREACPLGNAQGPHSVFQRTGYCCCTSQRLWLRHKVMWLRGRLQPLGPHPRCWCPHSRSPGTGVGCCCCCYCCCWTLVSLQLHQYSPAKHKIAVANKLYSDSKGWAIKWIHHRDEDTSVEGRELLLQRCFLASIRKEPTQRVKLQPKLSPWHHLVACIILPPGKETFTPHQVSKWCEVVAHNYPGTQERGVHASNFLAFFIEMG